MPFVFLILQYGTHEISNFVTCSNSIIQYQTRYSNFITYGPGVCNLLPWLLLAFIYVTSIHEGISYLSVVLSVMFSLFITLHRIIRNYDCIGVHL